MMMMGFRNLLLRWFGGGVDYVHADFCGAIRTDDHEALCLSLATEGGVFRYRLSIDDALRLFDRLGAALGSHHGPSAIRLDNARRFFSPGGRRPPEEAWVVELRDGRYLVSRYLHGKADEIYRPYDQDEVRIVVAAILSGHEPPADLRRREAPHHQDQPAAPHRNAGGSDVVEALSQPNGGLTPSFRPATWRCTVPALDAMGVAFDVGAEVVRLRLPPVSAQMLRDSLDYFLKYSNSQSSISRGSPHVDGSSPQDGKKV